MTQPSVSSLAKFGDQESRLTEGDTPGRSEHDKTKEHDHSILNKTPSTSEPVANDAHQNLANDDTNHFEVFDSLSPDLLTLCVR